MVGGVQRGSEVVRQHRAPGGDPDSADAKLQVVLPLPVAGLADDQTLHDFERRAIGFECRRAPAYLAISGSVSLAGR